MIKQQMYPISGGVPGLLRLVRRALSTNNIQSVSITAKGVEVSRELEDLADEVLAPGWDDPDMVTLLERVEIRAYTYNPQEAGLHAFYAACAIITNSKRAPVAVVAPSWRLFSAWFGMDRTESPPSHVFGIKLMVVEPQITNKRVILLGAKPYLEFLSDADMGISLDMGV